MNKQFLRDAERYPEQARKVITVDGEFTVERVELVKRTDRQSYVLTWYLTFRSGTPTGAWKRRTTALEHIERLKHPVQRGRKPLKSVTSGQLYRSLDKRPDLQRLHNAVRNCRPEEVDAILTAIKAAATTGNGAAAAEILTAYYADHKSGVVS